MEFDKMSVDEIVNAFRNGKAETRIASPATMWTIKGRATGPRKTTGTVETTSAGLLWKLTNPVVVNIYYGIPTDIPATWIDPDTPSFDSLAVIRYSENRVYLDKTLSGVFGEIEKNISDVEIIDPGNSYTKQIILQEAAEIPWLWIGGGIAAVLAALGYLVTRGGGK